jgi:transposase
MQDLDEHYLNLLGLGEPWSVADVDLNLQEMRVRIHIEHELGVGVECPNCGAACTIADHAPERKWRHLDTMQFATELVGRTPRADCKKCGVKTIAVPWAGKHSRFTLLFEAFAIRVLEVSSCVEKARLLLGLSWKSTQAIMGRGLERRKIETVRHAGMDEKSFRRGQDYISVLNDLDGGRVLDVVEKRTGEAADQLWAVLTPEQLARVEGVAMDMWEAYVNSAEKNVPDADIVHDKYHISAYLNEGVNKVRRQEHKELMIDGDESLKGTRQLWLFNMHNLTEEKWMSFERLLEMELKSAEAWAMKEQFRWFWDYKSAGWARRHFDKWYAWVEEAGIAPMLKVANMIKGRLDNLLTYFKHRITNAVSEGLNSKIQTLKSAARGFRGFQNYRTRILFFCGKLDMAVSLHSH